MPTPRGGGGGGGSGQQASSFHIWSCRALSALGRYDEHRGTAAGPSLSNRLRNSFAELGRTLPQRNGQRKRKASPRATHARPRVWRRVRRASRSAAYIQAALGHTNEALRVLEQAGDVDRPFLWLRVRPRASDSCGRSAVPGAADQDWRTASRRPVIPKALDGFRGRILSSALSVAAFKKESSWRRKPRRDKTVSMKGRPMAASQRPSRTSISSRNPSAKQLAEISRPFKASKIQLSPDHVVQIGA